VYKTNTLGWWRGVALCPITEVTVHLAGLVLGWMTVCGQVNHLSI